MISFEHVLAFKDPPSKKCHNQTDANIPSLDIPFYIYMHNNEVATVFFLIVANNKKNLDVSSLRRVNQAALFEAAAFRGLV